MFSLYLFEMYLFPSDEIAINQGYYTILLWMYACEMDGNVYFIFRKISVFVWVRFSLFHDINFLSIELFFFSNKEL